MASDIKIIFDPDNLVGDLELGNGELLRDNGIETAALISLFTDARAEDEELEDAGFNRNGWWGDLLTTIEGDQIGSKLYLLRRAKATQETLIRAKQYAYESLQWMIEDGLATKIEVDSWYFGDSWNKRLGLEVKIYQTSEEVTTLRFDDLWRNSSRIGG